MVGFRLAPIPFALCIIALAGCTPAQPTRARLRRNFRQLDRVWHGCGFFVQLAPGQQAYVQVQWEANWETGHTGGSSFAVETSSPDVAQQYIPTLTNLDQR